MTMTRQEQLDAVVRNYGAWKDGYDSAFWSEKYASCKGNGVVFVDSEYFDSMEVEGPALFRRAEVEQRKAELQNKPSWDDAPEWAYCIAQDENGRWHWYELIPEVIGYVDDGFSTIGGRFDPASEGEVIGDWRDTLEKRPVAGDLPKTDSELSGRLNSKVDSEDLMRSVARSNGLPEEMIFGLAVDSDQPTPEEEEAFNMLEARNGECIGGSLTDEGGKWDDEGLPPVGVECEISNCGNDFVWCKVNYIGKSLCVVDHENYSDQHYHLDSVKFRPIKSDREKWIEAVKEKSNTGIRFTEDVIDLLESIFDEGLACLPKVKK